MKAFLRSLGEGLEEDAAQELKKKPVLAYSSLFSTLVEYQQGRERSCAQCCSFGTKAVAQTNIVEVCLHVDPGADADARMLQQQSSNILCVTVYHS